MAIDSALEVKTNRSHIIKKCFICMDRINTALIQLSLYYEITSQLLLVMEVKNTKTTQWTAQYFYQQSYYYYFFFFHKVCLSTWCSGSEDSIMAKLSNSATLQNGYLSLQEAATTKGQTCDPADTSLALYHTTSSNTLELNRSRST